MLKELRERESVHHDIDLKRWFFCEYAEVRRMLRDPDHFTDPRKADQLDMKVKSLTDHIHREVEAYLKCGHQNQWGIYS